MASRPPYEVQDSLLLIIIGFVATVIVNILIHIQWFHIIFGDVDNYTAIQMLTVFFMAIITYLLTRKHRKKKEKDKHLEQDEPPSSLSNNHLHSYPPHPPLIFGLFDTHFHFPTLSYHLSQIKLSKKINPKPKWLKG